MLPQKARITKDAPLFEVGKRKIVYSDIDYNMHMNNTRYPDMLCDFLTEMTDESTAYRVSSLSLSYIKESLLGATLTITRGEMSEDGKINIRTLNEQGEACLEAIVGLEIYSTVIQNTDLGQNSLSHRCKILRAKSCYL